MTEWCAEKAVLNYVVNDGWKNGCTARQTVNKAARLGCIISDAQVKEQWLELHGKSNEKLIGV